MIKNYRDIKVRMDIYKKIFSKCKYPQTKVLDREWQHLIILDACRFDTFNKINWLVGEVDYIYSLGGATRQWMEKNFYAKWFDNICYITGNPNFHYISGSFAESIKCYNNEWNDKYHCTLPQTITENAIKYTLNHPHMNTIIHFGQPHLPIINEDVNKLLPANPKEFWVQLAQRKFSVDVAKFAYELNLINVLHHVEKLISKLKGKIIISSDHGNLFGEHGLYGHEPSIWHKNLIKVPWFEVC